MAIDYETLDVTGEIDLGREVLRIAVQRSSGKRVTVDIRRWYYNDEDELAPGRSGVSIPVLVKNVDKGEDIAAAIAAAFGLASEHAANDGDEPNAKSNGDGVSARSKALGRPKKAAAKKARATVKKAPARRRAVKR